MNDQPELPNDEFFEALAKRLDQGRLKSVSRLIPGWGLSGDHILVPLPVEDLKSLWQAVSRAANDLRQGVEEAEQAIEPGNPGDNSGRNYCRAVAQALNNIMDAMAPENIVGDVSRLGAVVDELRDVVVEGYAAEVKWSGYRRAILRPTIQLIRELGKVEDRLRSQKGSVGSSDSS